MKIYKVRCPVGLDQNTWISKIDPKSLSEDQIIEEKNKLKSTLIQFIDNNSVDLSNVDSITQEGLEGFIMDIFLNKNISIDEFKKFITSYKFDSQLIIDDEVNLNEEQWILLIENICDIYELPIFTEIPGELIDTNILYLEKFWEELNLEDIFNNWTLTNEILLAILDSKIINEKQKIELLTSENTIIEFLNSEHTDKVLFDKSASLLVKLTEEQLLNVCGTDFPMEKLLATSTNKLYTTTIIGKIINNKSTSEQLIHYISFINDTKLSNLFKSLSGRKNIEFSEERNLIIKALIKADFIGSHEFNEKSIKFNFKPSKFNYS